MKERIALPIACSAALLSFSGAALAAGLTDRSVQCFSEWSPREGGPRRRYAGERKFSHGEAVRSALDACYAGADRRAPGHCRILGCRRPLRLSSGAQPALASLLAQAGQPDVGAETPAVPPIPVAAAQADPPAPKTCLQEATGERNDPRGERRDFIALGRCRSVTGWEDPRGGGPVREWDADLCLGRYTDPADGRRVYLLWGEAEGRYDERSGLSLPIPRLAAAEGTFEKTEPDGTSLRESAVEDGDSVTLRRTVDFPSANLDPNKARNDQDGTMRFSKASLQMVVEMRWRSNYPFSLGQSWSAPLRLSLACEKEP